jgi:hypothetical protein
VEIWGYIPAIGKPRPKTVELIKQLRKYCAKRRGNQSALAQEVGVSRRRLTDWLNSRERLSLGRGLAPQRVIKSSSDGVVGKRLG